MDGDDYARVSGASLGLNSGPRIAVIYAAGTINGGKSGYDPVNGSVLGSETLIEYIRQARRDTSVAAIVLRIDSPGGSVIASDAIWRELMLAQNERPDRPIVASMSDLAASGGYYIAMPAQTIVAQPSTLTGSIGIFGGKIVTGGVYEKLGAHLESTSIGKTRGDRIADASVQCRRGARSSTSSCRRSTTSSSRRWPRRGTARRRRSTRWRKAACGPGGRRRTTAWLTRSAASTARSSWRSSAPRSRPDTDVELVVYPPRKSFYEILSDQLNGTNESVTVGRWLSANLSTGELDVLRDDCGGPLAMFRRGEPLALMPFTFLR